MKTLGEIVVDIPIEDQAAEKALEIAVFYEGRGWIPRDSYTWVLYARSNMSYELLQSFRQDIIVAAQRWKLSHGLEDNLFALIVELARAGVIWRPAPPTPELRAETFWLWKEMGLAAIRDRALAAAGVALREEAESIRRKVAILDGVAGLPKRIAMGTYEAAMASAKKAIGQYLDVRNKITTLVYQSYPQLSPEGKALADDLTARIGKDDQVIRDALAKANMTLADFGSVVPAAGLGAFAVTTTIVVIVLSAVVVYIGSIINSYLAGERALETEQLEAAKDAKNKALTAVEIKKRRRILGLSPELSDEERAAKIAEIESWAAEENARIAREYKPPTPGLPWAWILGATVAAPVTVYGAGRAFGWIKKKPKPSPPPVRVGKKRGPKTGWAKFWKENKSYFAAAGGAAALLGMFGMSAYLLRWIVPPAAPQSRLPEPEVEPYEPQF